ncbi:MAG TPA: hypothetical protein VK877_13720 [Pseudolabrys sp.]|nr:hypothetical protein [Pseudolabrys sp.]
MSRPSKFLAGAAVIFSIVAFMPASADAHWRGGYWRGGWGWGPAFGLGLGIGHGWGWGYPYAYPPGPYYYGTPYYGRPACGWVRVRAWRNGHRVYRRVWRCW